MKLEASDDTNIARRYNITETPKRSDTERTQRATQQIQYFHKENQSSLYGHCCSFFSRVAGEEKYRTKACPAASVINQVSLLGIAEQRLLPKNV